MKWKTKPMLARVGDAYLFKCANYWGKSTVSPDAAFKAAQAAGAGYNPKQWVLYSVHPSAYCEECFGDTVSPKDHPPVLLQSFGMEKTKRVPVPPSIGGI